MLNYAAMFVAVALLAGLFGFGGLAAGVAGLAKILFFVFVVLAGVSLVASLIRDAHPTRTLGR